MNQREIKFRLRIDNKIVGYEKWYGGHFGGVTSAKPCWLYSKDNKYWNPEYIYHKQKDQFTGLKDKNGKEIYEGDILKSQIDNKISVIEWDCAGFKIKGVGMGTNIVEIDLEVIGNIYENPELLK